MADARGAMRLTVLIAAAVLAMPETALAARTMAEVLAATRPADWRAPDPENTLYLDLDGGRVVIELAPLFAPRHVDNIRKLAREGYYDGLGIIRVQDNFVVQWGDAAGTKPLGSATKTLAAEFTRPAAGLTFTVLPDPDTYAAETGFVSGFPAAREGVNGSAWLAHCYGMVGAGRDNDADSGGGTELYVVTGHAPRQLDRNITVVGRVVQGMELLAALPRGPAPMGFYEDPAEGEHIRKVRVAADVPAEQRAHLELLRTDTQAFQDLVEARRNRSEEWYKFQVGRIDVCNVPLPVRPVEAP